MSHLSGFKSAPTPFSGNFLQATAFSVEFSQQSYPTAFSVGSDDEIAELFSLNCSYFTFLGLFVGLMCQVLC